MVKTTELTGTEVKVEGLGGQNVAVKNLGSGSIYVSAKPNVTAGEDNVIEIPAGAGEVVLDAHGTVYIVGTGKVQCTGTSYAVPNFKLPSSSSGGGGGTSDVTKAYVDTQDTTNLSLAKSYTDNQLSYVKDDISELETNKADAVHNHDDRYYTETETDTKLSEKIDGLLKGSANGVAELDANGKVPISQLPSYVDDVIEFSSLSDFPTAGETGKIYLDTGTNLTYRWSGSEYVEISPSIALGETSSTAYRGDRGKIAYEHSQSPHAPITAQENVIETVKVNGTAVTPNSKEVDITVPTKTSELINDAGFITSGGGGGTSDVTKEYVDAQDATNLNLAKAYTDNAKSEIQTTIDTVDDTLNTHIADTTTHITAGERAAWNAKAETDTATSTANGLMSAADKKKLDGIEAKANKYTLPVATSSILGGVKLGYSTNGKNYKVTSSNAGLYVNVPWTDTNTTYTNFVKSGSGAKSGLVPAPSTTAGTTKYLREDGTWTVPPDTTYGEVTQSTAGLMSAADKKKLDGIAAGATKVTVDSALSTESTNPVQNKIVKANLDLKANVANPTFKGTLSQSRRNGGTIGDFSVALGVDGTASAPASIAAGGHCIASADNAVSIGYASNCQNEYAQTLGMLNCSGNGYGLIAGRLNKISSDAAFCLGYGSLNSGFDWANKPDTTTYYTYGRNNSTQKNIFRVNTSGAVYGVGAYNTSGADYAEYIKEWADGNPNGEDRRGYLVTVKDGKLHKAESGDYIVGITSGNPSIIGNADEDWLGRWQRDEFNSLIYKEVEVPDFEEQVDENGDIKTVKVGSHTEMQTVENPDYDKTLPYVERKDRPEWSAVGMIGILPLRDDGTCEAGGFAKCGVGGVATKADTYDCHSTFFVIERISENVISVEMR